MAHLASITDVQNAVAYLQRYLKEIPADAERLYVDDMAGYKQAYMCGRYEAVIEGALRFLTLGDPDASAPVQ